MNQKFHYFIIYSLLLFNLIMILVTTGVIIFSEIAIPHDSALAQTMKSVFGTTPLTALTIILFEILTSFIFILLLQSSFKKTFSPEIFFIILALGGIPFEAFRDVVFLTRVLNKLYFLYILVPRFVYFGKLLTALALFVSGLFSTGFNRQKHNTFIGLVFLFAFLLSSTIPIDYSVHSTLLLPGGKSPYILQNILYSLYLLAFLNYLAGAYSNKNKNFVFCGIGMAMFVTGIEVLFPLQTGVQLITGCILYLSGLFLSNGAVNKIYTGM